jgi:general secretion pathway protein D
MKRMEKVILSLIAASAACLLVSASAQPATGDQNTNTPPATDQGGQPQQPGQPVALPDNGNAPDNGAPLPQVPPPDGAQPGTAAPEQNEPQPPLVITPSRSLGAERQLYESNFMPPGGSGTNAADLNLNFNHAPLEMVLNYLSDAAGFIVVQETRINSGITITVNGKHLTRSEAVDLLNSVLNKNGYAAIRDGRTLTIMDKTEAKTGNIPVKDGNNPDSIPNNDEIATWIIPIRFVEARQLVSDLSSFVSPQATVVANEAGNSIVITDTQANIHHLAEIIKAVDDSAEAETEIQVFTMKYANPTEVAADISAVFPSSTSGNTTQSPIRFGGGGPGGGGPGGFFRQMMANAAAGSGGSSSDRIKKATQVLATADARTSSVIVTAPKDMMQEIGDMIEKLDVPSERDQNVFVYKLNNADSQTVATELQNMFGGNNSRTSTQGQNQNSALQQRAQNSTTTMSSQGSSTGLGGSSFGGGGGGRGGLGQ